MWPLLGCSVVAVALVIDRLIALVSVRLNFTRFAKELEHHLADGDSSAAIALCGSRRSPVARTAKAYLTQLRTTRDERHSIVRREGALALEKVEKRLRGLATIAQVSTLMGLLGTVAGLVAAFRQIELASGQVQPGDLAEGIWAALLTTVFGLTIAIPSFLASQAFESRVDAIARRMEFIVSYLDQWLGESGPTTVPPLSARPAEVVLQKD